MTEPEWLKWGAVFGAVAVVDYLAVPFIPQPVKRLAFFAEGPLFVAFALSLSRALLERRPSLSAWLAGAFGAVGGAVMTLMAVVQNSINATMSRLVAAEADEAARLNLRVLWKGLDSVQLGMDVVFDIFWLTALALFGLSMARDDRFGRVIGWVGAVVCVACLAINVWSFPTPPRPDLGPLIGLWGVAVVIAAWRAVARVS
jgi:drug/metabolite transporter superfamily protein YnfA